MSTVMLSRSCSGTKQLPGGFDLSVAKVCYNLLRILLDILLADIAGSKDGRGLHQFETVLSDIPFISCRFRYLFDWCNCLGRRWHSHMVRGYQRQAVVQLNLWHLVYWHEYFLHRKRAPTNTNRLYIESRLIGTSKLFKPPNGPTRTILPSWLQCGG